MTEREMITAEVIQEFSEKAARSLGKDILTPEDFVGLAQEAEKDERFYAAAVYYTLAGIKSLPQESASTYQDQAQEMLWRVRSAHQRPPGE